MIGVVIIASEIFKPVSGSPDVFRPAGSRNYEAFLAGLIIMT